MPSHPVTSTEQESLMLSKIVGELVQAREAWGMSREDLANLMHVAPGTVKFCENGNKQPSMKLLVRWANTLGCDITITPRG